MRHITKIIFLLFAVLPQLSFASDKLVVTTGSSTLTIKPDTASECQVTSIEKYKRHFLFQYDYDHKYYYLITQKFEVGEGCFEGNDPANVNITAHKIDVNSGRLAKEPIWSFSTKGASGERARYELDGLYTVAYPGCCGATNTIKYFGLLSGKLIGASSLRPLIIEIPNTKKVRYITVQDENASDYMGKKLGAATVFYSDNEMIKQELVITVPNARTGSCYLTGLRFAGKKEDDRSYSLWEKSTFEGFSIIAELGCERDHVVAIEIPVIADMLSSVKTTIKGMSNCKIEDVTHHNKIQRSGKPPR